MTQPYDPTMILHHLGEDDIPFNAVSPPIFQTSIFDFDSFESFREGLAHEENHFLYSRGNNPTVNLCELKIAALEKAQKAKLVSSGVAAISSAILAFISSGDHVVCVRDCYSWTRSLLEKYLPRFGVEHTFVEGTRVKDFEAAIRPETRVIYLESPTTLTFKLQDLAEVAGIARERGIKTVIDNTWATPFFQNPIELGVDISLHSVSKYLGGHSDVVAGVLTGSKKDIDHIFRTEFLQLGPVPDPMMAWLVLRGMRTLAVRMAAHFENAKRVASYLEGHPAVESVSYPFLPSHPQYQIATAQMRGGSGLFSFRLATRDLSRIRRFVDELKIFRRAVSWGGYESLIVPNAIHYTDGPLTDDMAIVRLHIGLENTDVLIGDLDQALRQVV